MYSSAANRGYELLRKELNERVRQMEDEQFLKKRQEFTRRLMKDSVFRWRYQVLTWALGKKKTDVLIRIEELEKTWVDAVDPDITIWDGITPARCRVQIDALWYILRINGLDYILEVA